MENLFIPGSSISPEVSFDTDTWQLRLSGFSIPEDVRSLYYPIIEWLNSAEEAIDGNPGLIAESGINLIIDLVYFNSSSGKFLYDIFSVIASLKKKGHKAEVIWYYDPEDTDMAEAASDMAMLAEMEFSILPKQG